MRNRRRSVRWNTMRILAAGFLGVIFLGGVLLWLPVSNQQPIAFIDALFTSTTAVCVTGLVTITPATQFTLFGKIVLMLLIQIGGLGVVACMASFFFLLRKRITVKERIVIQETYNMDRLGGIVGLVKKVIIGTFRGGRGRRFVLRLPVCPGIWTDQRAGVLHLSRHLRVLQRRDRHPWDHQPVCVFRPTRL